MHCIYPYNEILPKRTAHDVYVMRNCASLAKEIGKLDLLYGRGSLEPAALFAHYEIEPPPQLALHALPILRKSSFLSLSWNRPFFYFSQRFIARVKPDWVLMSILKQAAYHVQRRLPGIRYAYEVHGVRWYPGQPLAEKQQRQVAFERGILQQMDLVTVTTRALEKLLRQPPYKLTNRIEVIPLATQKGARLPFPQLTERPLMAMYIGQLYAEQGVDLLLQALSLVPQIHLTVVGGKEEEIQAFRQRALQLGIAERVIWKGFCAPQKIASIAETADLFVAPFVATGLMPYVAHTKLLEYLAWGRPVIAPKLAGLDDHFPPGYPVRYFQAEEIESLAEQLRFFANRQHLQEAFQKISTSDVPFTWEERAKRYAQCLQKAPVFADKSATHF